MERGKRDRETHPAARGADGRTRKPAAGMTSGGEHENRMCPTAAIAKRSANPEFLAGRQVGCANSRH